MNCVLVVGDLYWLKCCINKHTEMKQVLFNEHQSKVDFIIDNNISVILYCVCSVSPSSNSSMALKSRPSRGGKGSSIKSKSNTTQDSQHCDYC